MFFGQTPQEIRQVFINTFNQYLAKSDLTPLEQTIIAVILEHPEYHEVLLSGDKALERHYFPEFGEINPFLHMGLHLALREQISTDRPLGIRSLAERFIKTHKQHELEHQWMDILAEFLWKAQKENKMPDEQAYLSHLKDISS